jgi:hypothetical protein
MYISPAFTKFMPQNRESFLKKRIGHGALGIGQMGRWEALEAGEKVKG